MSRESNAVCDNHFANPCTTIRGWHNERILLNITVLFEHWTIIYDKSTKCCITYIYDNISTYRQYIYINKSYNIVSKGDGMQFLGIMLWESLLGCAHLQSQSQCRIIPQSHTRSLFPTTWFFPNQSTKHMPVRMQISSLSQGHWLPRVDCTMHDGGCIPQSWTFSYMHLIIVS